MSEQAIGKRSSATETNKRTTARKEYEEEEQEEEEDDDEVVGMAKFDERLVAVSDAIEHVQPPGDFFTSGERALFPMPLIVVDGVGDVSLPLNDVTAKTLIEKCHLAPYGLGEQTLVDLQVRNPWELSSSQFRIENPAWKPFVVGILEACRVPLGISLATRMEAKLYKMMLYEPGGKFEKHQDSEKEDGMFGTLVVVLPCRFEGGELEVHDPSAGHGHGLKESKRVWNPAKADVFDVKYTAFYGDCPHEVKPITNGHRLCLAYNLVIVGKDVAAEGVPHFTGSFPPYEPLKSSLCAFFAKSAGESAKRARVNESGNRMQVRFDLTDPTTHRWTKFVYMLHHKYTAVGLALKNLKWMDALVAENLAQVCRESNGALELYLCKARYEFNRHGDEGDTWDSDRDEEEEDSDRPEPTKTLKLLPKCVRFADEHASLQACWSDYVACDFESEVGPAGFFDKRIVMDGEDRQMFTGNEGSTYEIWYVSAALVVLPLALRYKLSFAASPLETLESWVALVDKSPQLAKAMAPGFADASGKWSSAKSESSVVLEALTTLKCLSVVHAVLTNCEFIDFQPKLREVVAVLDWEGVVNMTKDLQPRWKKYHNSREISNAVNLVASMLEERRTRQGSNCYSQP